MQKVAQMSGLSKGGPKPKILERISSHLKMVQTGQEARLYALTRLVVPGVLLPRPSVHDAVEKIMLECPKIPSSSILKHQAEWDSVAGVGSGNDVELPQDSAHARLQCICAGRQNALKHRQTRPCIGGCGTSFHPECMGRNVRVCVLCRLRAVDSLWEPLPASEGGILPISPAQLLPPNTRTYPKNVRPIQALARRTFTLGSGHKVILAAGNRSEGQPGRVQVRATCFKLNDELVNRVNWPTGAELMVNGYSMQCYSRYSDQPLGPNGRDSSIDISQYCVLGDNHVTLTSRGRSVQMPYPFVLVVRMAQAVDLGTMERTVLARWKETSSSDGGVARMKKILGVGGDGADEDDDLVATSTIVPLRCPLSGMRIETPTRSRVCSHLKVFDLHSFLLMNSRSQKWQCPFCMRSALVRDLEVDLYLQGILAAVKRLPGNDEVAEVEVRPSDLSWRAYYGKVKGAGKWVAVGQEPEEDALQGGEAKAALTLGQVKPEPGGGNSKPNVNGEAAPAPSISDESLSEGEEMRRAAEAARGLKRPRPVTVINLSDSEDEAKPAPPRQQSEGTVRAGPATGTMGGTTVPRYLPSLTREFQNDPNCPDFSRTEWAVREMWRDEKRRAAENTGNRQTPRQGTANNPLDL